ncbi:dopamine receptor 2 [Hydra vulgaris]|uniref:dopamine receptor 2 n=1 Tax=Hydra vulgaris TaxID=6087 RepID=UPI001F5FA5BB|nr:dopamine receptor 2 [Hydra vulgaris]
MSKSTLEIFNVIILISIDVCALTGNCMIILAFIIGPKSLKTLTNYFVVNLAVADLMVAILPLPFWIAYQIDYNIINRNAVYFFITTDVLFGITSILSLTAISLERMFAVKFPTRHFNLSSALVFIVIAFTWFIGIVFSVAQFFISFQNVRWYIAFLLVFAYIFPLFIIVVSYCIIYCAIRMMRDNSNQDGKTKQELRVAKIISIIIGLFFICWSPFFILNTVHLFCKEVYCRKLPIWLINITKMLHYSHSMMNFFVYGYRSPDFRHIFRAFLKCRLSLMQGRVRSLSESINLEQSSSFKRERNIENSEEVLVTLASDEI